jgi:RNA polymerase sigma-70 factor (ECF subfamily)
VLAALTELERLTAEANGLVLRLGHLYGPGSIYSLGGSFAQQVQAGKVPLVGGGHAVFSFTHADDAAIAIAAALDRKDVTGVVNVVDDSPAELREWLPVYAELLGAKAPKPAPAALARLAVGGWGVAYMNELRGADNARARLQLNWRPRYTSWADGFAAELRDTLSYATLHLMERLTPPQRAVFVLREAFDLPYEDIAKVIGDSVVNCRQLHHRASKRLAAGRDRFQPSPTEHGQLLTQFLDAARSGDLETLKGLFSEDVVAYNDGGGMVRAALRPIVGRDHVIAFVAGLMERYPIEQLRPADANGDPAVWTILDGQEQLVTVDVQAGRITAIYAILNPDKLTHIRPASL